jgi:hypothetical protein
LKIMVQVLVGDFTAGASFDTFLFAISAVVFTIYYRRMGRDL